MLHHHHIAALNYLNRARLFIYTIILLCLHCQLASADLGRLSWGALSPQNGTAGYTLYGGDGTFYGQQANQTANGACSYGSAKSNTLDLPWTDGTTATIALNSDQFQQGLACGTCMYFRGTGGGIGTTPVSLDWQFAFVDNVCPECAFGSIDLNSNGNGRWNIEWFPAPCNVGNSSFVYVNSVNANNPNWFQFSIGNTRVPIQKVEMYSGGKWGEMRRTYNNMFAADGGPFNNWPLPLRITSFLNDTVYDELPSVKGGNGTAQFPSHGPATFPKDGVIAETVYGQRAAKVPAPPLSEAAQEEAAPEPTESNPTDDTATASASAIASQKPEQSAAPPAEGISQALTPDSSSDLGTAIDTLTTAVKGTSPPANASGFDLDLGLPPVASIVDGKSVFQVVAGGQCGGDTSYCSKLGSSQCKDAVWSGAQCPKGLFCQRWNTGWWQCNYIGSQGDEQKSVLGRKLFGLPTHQP